MTRGGRRGSTALCVALALLTNATDAYHPTSVALTAGQPKGHAGMVRRGRVVVHGASRIMSGDGGAGQGANSREAQIAKQMRDEG